MTDENTPTAEDLWGQLNGETLPKSKAKLLIGQSIKQLKNQMAKVEVLEPSPPLQVPEGHVAKSHCGRCQTDTTIEYLKLTEDGRYYCTNCGSFDLLINIEEVDDTPPEPTKTCRFLAPSQPFQDEYGVSTPSNWEFSRMPTYFPCMNPTFNERGKINCDCLMGQTQCMFYEPDVPVVIKQYVVGEQDVQPAQRVTLLRKRTDVGYEDFEVVEQSADENGIWSSEPTILHSISNIEHKLGTADLANGLLHTVLDEYELTTEVPVESNTTTPAIVNSYLKSLIEVA